MGHGQACIWHAAHARSATSGMYKKVKVRHTSYGLLTTYYLLLTTPTPTPNTSPSPGGHRGRHAMLF